jgi:hypothetical protein
MQFIEGQTLAALVEQLQPSAASGTPTLPVFPAAETHQGPALSTENPIKPPTFVRRVAEWGIQAAEALAHAHQVGVVHRDVKPANLIVDSRGNLWVTDFGLAHVQGDTRLTMTGNLVGTFRYMSPEQASGKPAVDHRTDIYSLGATLYELLTLRSPFESNDRQELLRKIDHEEPVAPRTLNKTIPVDLETIVLKAMAKHCDERYHSAGELAEDLRCFLEHRPVRARRPTFLERIGKWTRRHRAVTLSACLLLLLTAAGFAVSTALIAREQSRTQTAYDQLAEEQVRTREAFEAEAAQRARAEESFRQARQVVDFISQIAEEELRDRPDLQEVRRKLLEVALDYYRDFIERGSGDPTIQTALAASHVRVAEILREIGTKADAKAALERARAILDTLPPDQHPPFGRGRPWGVTESSTLPLLVQKPIQEELKLGESVVKKITQLSAKRREASLEFRRESAEEHRERIVELATQEKALLATLTPEQSQRLKQIILQQRGVKALGDSDVADALHLSGEQKEKIRGIINEDRRSAWGGPSGRGRPDPRRRGERPSKTALNENLLSVLNPAQKSHWKEIVGEAFKGEIIPAFGGPPGPGRDFRPSRP